MTIVLVHGGVSGTRRDTETDLASAVASSSTASSAVDAVENAIRVLEDDPALNAGYGSVLTRDGGLELDAGIADGSSGRAGGVANVDFAHPISVARLVLEQTPHVLMTGGGIQELGLAHGFDRLEGSTPEQHDRWNEAGRGLDDKDFARPEHVDTVGAVALADRGTLAAGSSTGGVFGKLRGRVGDAPIFGAGFYADATVAVVGTGVGEAFLLTLACRRVAEAMARGAGVQQACEEVVALIQRRPRLAPSEGPVAAGLLALDRDGSVGAAYSGASWQLHGPTGPVEAREVRPSDSSR